MSLNNPNNPRGLQTGGLQTGHVQGAVGGLSAKGRPIGNPDRQFQTRSRGTDGSVPIIGEGIKRAWEWIATKRFEEREILAVSSADTSGPFRLSVVNVSGVWKWSVSSSKSSITDGTNGDAIDLGAAGVDWAVGAIKFDVETPIAATKYIVLEANVDSALNITDWTFAAVDLADTDEVGIDSGPPVVQNKIRLLIGKIVVDTAPDPDTYTAIQAVYSAQRITNGLLNALPVKVFENSEINAADL